MAKATMAEATAEKPVQAPEASPALMAQIEQLQRVASLGVLAGGICHELNNILTPILNYAKLGLRDSDPEFKRKAFEKIQEAAQRAATITTGVLGLVRPQVDRRDPVDLVTLTEQVLLLTTKDLQKHGVRLEFRSQGRPHARVNPAQIQQVLLNLIINARQAMPDGGLLLLTVRSDAAGRTGEIQVCDSGVGIPPEVLKRIFEPFFTTKQGPDSNGLGGTGLGLPMCRQIVESHKGRLRVESRPGQGTKFTLRVPLCVPPEGSTSA